jgi:cytochrome oxidase assembly protein ShyY1
MQVMFSRRWLTALVVAIAFAVACVFLGRWQWHRHDAKVARADRINSHYYARPVSLQTVLPTTGETLPRSQEWTRVTATGTYADGNLQLVRNRPNDGVYGYEVVVPLDLPGGASLLVDRGWVMNANQAAERPDVPVTPRGTITVTGWLRVGEPSLGRQMPPGQLASINLPEARRATGADLYGTYLIMDR